MSIYNALVKIDALIPTQLGLSPNATRNAVPVELQDYWRNLSVKKTKQIIMIMMQNFMLLVEKLCGNGRMAIYYDLLQLQYRKREE